MVSDLNNGSKACSTYCLLGYSPRTVPVIKDSGEDVALKSFSLYTLFTAKELYFRTSSRLQQSPCMLDFSSTWGIIKLELPPAGMQIDLLFDLLDALNLIESNWCTSHINLWRLLFGHFQFVVYIMLLLCRDPGCLRFASLARKALTSHNRGCIVVYI